MAQSVKHLSLAQVMILGSWDRALPSVWSLLVSLPLPLPRSSLLPLSVSHTLTQQLLRRYLLLSTYYVPGIFFIVSHLIFTTIFPEVNCYPHR